MTRMLYFDDNATSFPLPHVRAAFIDSLQLANPSSIHSAGREARAAVELSRLKVAESLGIKPVQLIFTSGATETNALAANGIHANVYACSAVEHHAVTQARDDFAILPVHSNGLIDLEILENWLAHHPHAWVGVQLANNETGIIQPIAQIAALVHHYNGLLHCDAVQAWGRIPIHFQELGVDSLALSAHKAGGPKGIGILAVREGLAVTPLLRGGGQEQRRRGGTENVPGIVALGAFVQALPELIAKEKVITGWRDQLQKGLQQHSDIQVIGTDVPRLPNTLLYVQANQPATTRLMQFDLAGFAVSSGAACSSGKVGASHVLQAMGLSTELAQCAIRISLGWHAHADAVQQLENFLSQL